MRRPERHQDLSAYLRGRPTGHLGAATVPSSTLPLLDCRAPGQVRALPTLAEDLAGIGVQVDSDGGSGLRDLLAAVCGLGQAARPVRAQKR